MEEKAAVLLHSLVGNHALIDGNKRLALAATIAFLGVNGRRLSWSNDEAYELIIDVVTGQLGEVASRVSTSCPVPVRTEATVTTAGYQTKKSGRPTSAENVLRISILRFRGLPIACRCVWDH